MSEQPQLRRGSAAARLRLVRRAASALRPLEQATIKSDLESEAIDWEDSGSALRTDMLITASDLRLRVATMPNSDAETVLGEAALRAALGLLLDAPETAAVVIVADDELLTSRIVEPFDQPGAFTSRAILLGEDQDERIGPLGQLIRTYLRQIVVNWDAVRPLVGGQDDVRVQAGILAQAAISRLQSKRKNTPEWKNARAALGVQDAVWAADLAIRLRLDPEADVHTSLSKRARGAP